MGDDVVEPEKIAGALRSAPVLGLVLSGVLAQALGVCAVFVLCAALAVALACGGRTFLRQSKRAIA